VKPLRIYIGILGVIGRPFERSCSKPATLNFVAPDIRIDVLEIVFKNEAVLEIVSLSLKIVAGRIRTSMFDTEA